MSKRCYRCKVWKPKSDFYANKQSKDGLDCWCKKCRKKNTSQWRRDNPARCRELKQHWKTQEKDTEYKARHRARHPDRHYARRQLLKAREHGLKLDHCVWPGCTETENIEGHHPDYSKPHEIVSICLLHHKATDLLGDKLGFDLPSIDISAYIKPTRRPCRGKGLCPICGGPKDRPDCSYCRLCRNAYQRAHPRKDKQRKAVPV